MMSENRRNPLAGLTADVATLLTYEEQREATAGLSKGQRKQRQRDAARRKVTLDFSGAEWLEEQVRAAAEQEACGLSSYALWLLQLGLEYAQRAGVKPRKRNARSLKYDYDVVIENQNHV